MRKSLLIAALAALLANPASAVTIDWVPIGNAGNAADTPSSNCYAANCGSVAYDYWISKYEVTNAQYAELLEREGGLRPARPLQHEHGQRRDLRRHHAQRRLRLLHATR